MVLWSPIKFLSRESVVICFLRWTGRIVGNHEGEDVQKSRGFKTRAVSTTPGSENIPESESSFSDLDLKRPEKSEENFPLLLFFLTSTVTKLAEATWDCYNADTTWKRCWISDKIHRERRTCE
ncbi:hypothetical protein Fot_22159 [Forsythia ovata]|uniref:Uncharacterized protein n=1 Tax=Forsythia ovata TaxID=205694 RepID=A0ABD1UWX0_9LAMI